MQSFTASLFRHFSGFMSDLFQRKGWTSLPFIARSLPYAPRLHWLGSALILITLGMAGLAFAGMSGSLHLSVAVLGCRDLHIVRDRCTFALLPLLFPDRPGAAARFIGGVSTAAGIVYPLIFSSGTNMHMGYLYAALYLFVPFIMFYFWAARYERHPEEHGLLTRVFAPLKRRNRAAVCGPQILTTEVHHEYGQPANRIGPHEPWYKYGVAVLLIEMAIAIAVSGYSLYMTFHGRGGFPGKH